MEHTVQNRILRLKDVINMTGLSRTTIYARMDFGAFPESINLGGRAVGWLEADIDAWIDERIEESRGE